MTQARPTRELPPRRRPPLERDGGVRREPSDGLDHRHSSHRFMVASRQSRGPAGSQTRCVSNDIGGPATLPSAPRVVIVDADHRVRSGMAGLLELADGLTIAAAVGTVDEALAAGRLDPDAFLIDPRLPETEDGLALIGRLRSVAPRARVLVMWWTPAVAEAALACGADGVIDKCEDATPFTEDLLAALAAPRAGSLAVPGLGTDEPAIEQAAPPISAPEDAFAPRPAHP